MSPKFYFNLSTVSITFGGTGIYAWELCHRLMRLTTPLEVIPYTCPFKTLGKTGIPRLINAFFRDTIWDYFLAGLESDNVDDYFIFAAPDVPKKFYRRKFAVIIHDLGAWHDPSITTLGGKLFIKALPETTKHAELVITVSEYSARDIMQQLNVPKEKIVVAPNGLSHMYKKTNAPIKIINGIELPENYFLHVGNFDPKKNFSFLLKLYENFRNQTDLQGGKIKLILTGGLLCLGSEANIFTEIRNHPYAEDIIVLGKVKSEELPSLYQQAIAFIFPSTFEGFGIPVIEALSQGTPVLVNDNTALTQFSKFGATVFPDFALDTWTDKLQEIVVNCLRIESIYIERIREYFDWDRTAKIIGEAIGLSSI